MISDTLAEAANEIVAYLNHPVMGKLYKGVTRTRIENLVEDMTAMCNYLDFPDTPKTEIR